VEFAGGISRKNEGLHLFLNIAVDISAGEYVKAWKDVGDDSVPFEFIGFDTYFKKRGEFIGVFCRIWGRRLFRVLSVLRSLDSTWLEAQLVQVGLVAVVRRRGLVARWASCGAQPPGPRR